MEKKNETTYKWFKHDAYLRDNQIVEALLQDYGWEHYGVLIGLMEEIFKNGGYIEADSIRRLSYRMHANEQTIKNIISTTLFTLEESDNHIKVTCEAITAQLNKINHISETNKAAARARWNGCERNASAIRAQYGRISEKRRMRAQYERNTNAIRT